MKDGSDISWEVREGNSEEGCFPYAPSVFVISIICTCGNIFHSFLG